MTGKLWRWIIVVGGLTALLFAGLFWLFGPLSPQAVCNRSLRALSTGDAEELLRRADPDELKALNLTRTNVEAILRQTSWRDGLPAIRDIDRRPGKQADMAMWQFRGAADKPGGPTGFMALLDDPHKGWTLDLSDFLFHECIRTAGDPKEGTRLFISLAHQHGITGLLRPDGVTLRFAPDGSLRPPRN